MAESIDNGETELTMCDVLKEEEELEEDAQAVLGDSDDTNCTYNEGYVARQALYACATCSSTSDGDFSGGICLACSYACHENHELIELYTKRHFRCDCGHNTKFPNNPCRLIPNKDEANTLNSYNHNFQGLYCSCSRPYPDPTDATPDQMIQCVICEDWYHGRHLGSKVPDNEDFGEMICAACMKKHDFLCAYKAHLEAQSLISVDDNPTVVKKEETGQSNGEQLPAEDVEKQPDVSTSGQVKREANGDVKVTCSFKALGKHEVVEGTSFLPEKWRSSLCRCDECLTMYEKENCAYLLDENDTIQAYEERGKSRNGDESQYDKGLSALGRLGRVQQIEAIHEYNNMKVQLKDYLKTFADAKRTVSAKDIQDFFESMQQRKRQRVNAPPHFCR